MSTSYRSDYERITQRQILWNESRCTAAKLLAEGHTYAYTAEQIGVHPNTIYNWMNTLEFAAEVDRLTLMTGMSSRAERLRVVSRLARQRIREDGYIESDKDLLDWLKFGQSETDGAKIDLSKLSELFTGDNQDDDNRLLPSPAIEVEAGHQQSLSQPAEPSAPQDIVGPSPDEHNRLLDQPVTPDDA